ncbi:hypothetical protein ABZ825_22280 [Streptomyces tauricus]|uniref:hypothetical protein n=1 Tax=Streptomyces tauricus TaxID=68274 RepID=UPI0033FABA18
MPATDGLGGPAGEFLDLGGRLLDAPGQQPEREHSCIVAVGKIGARGDQGCVAEVGQGLAQLGIDAEEYDLELILRLRAGLNGRLLRQPEHTHGLLAPRVGVHVNVALA